MCSDIEGVERQRYCEGGPVQEHFHLSLIGYFFFVVVVVFNDGRSWLSQLLEFGNF